MDIFKMSKNEKLKIELVKKSEKKRHILYARGSARYLTFLGNTRLKIKTE